MNIKHTVTRHVMEDVDIDAREVFNSLRDKILSTLNIPKSSWFDEKEGILRYHTAWSVDTKEITEADLEIFKALNTIKSYLEGIG
jgi:hypothetical protein